MMNPNAASIHYQDLGRGDPVLLVHGFLLSGYLWHAVAPSLSPSYRLIIPDLPGHGRSPSSSSSTMGEYAGALASLLEQAGDAEPVVLIGMSMGGYIAFEFYRRYRDRVRALVLVNTRAQADSRDDAQARRALIRRVGGEGSRAAAEALLPGLFGSRASPELLGQWMTLMTATTPGGTIAALQAMAQRPDSFPTLASATCPILIIAGEEDALTPPRDARRMHQATDRGRLRILPDAGHMTPVECPQAFLKTLRSFLDHLPRSTP
jgi:pimeloyl-ACP methyl ester carboxylesterase